jgi:hypothetical protein
MAEDDYKFRITGTSFFMSLKDLDDAMQKQYRYEITNIDRRMVEIFDNKLKPQKTRTLVGKMPVPAALEKFK